MTEAERTRIAVLGAGSWGTALAALLAANGASVRLWARDCDQAATIDREHQNPRYLPGVNLPDSLDAGCDLAAAVEGADQVWLVLPTKILGDFLAEHREVLPRSAVYVTASKGFEPGTGRRIDELVADALGDVSFAVVSGPTFAIEVAHGRPAALAVGSRDRAVAETVAVGLRNDRVRCYPSSDVVGIELAGGLKNVLAIAAGVSDGFGFGANARAALITRGLAEIMRLGEAMGARAETFFGLAGLGDLVLTCTDDHSRNRQFGLRLARGESVDAAVAAIGQAVEGISAAREGHRLAQASGQELPITECVYRVLYEGLPAREAVSELLSREQGHDET
ncbi:NAD(P)-dependent glycerol-3-phosphate dehydrogenase [Guyparkeria hydrothermalis]|uniref:NAD(P)H-dependent glycerol-3-phosphate dehydrogenase n=1 Tax=Guyparkeria hydrothermalis TaxID=923 RepID=UPI00202072CF|nr:NAD(P)H-dependent glycerol-3-phosphate dehydrogenase [Guyparkeria hydrothermalis]MCL7744936.1 NAD(P)-dependent glycerol-3-phosphate dehydrogenase [Guyparkeria hydrothermalis]